MVENGYTALLPALPNFGKKFKISIKTGTVAELKFRAVLSMS
jgi:hypothetical protein